MPIGGGSGADPGGGDDARPRRWVRNAAWGAAPGAEAAAAAAEGAGLLAAAQYDALARLLRGEEAAAAVRTELHVVASCAGPVPQQGLWRPACRCAVGVMKAARRATPVAAETALGIVARALPADRAAALRAAWAARTAAATQRLAVLQLLAPSAAPAPAAAACPNPLPRQQQPAAGGAWPELPRAPPAPSAEIRVDPSDGQAYPLSSFMLQYGVAEGKRRWAAARLTARRPPAAPAAAQGGVMRG